MEITRRSFITGIIAACLAPAVVKIETIMPIKPIKPIIPVTGILLGFDAPDTWLLCSTPTGGNDALYKMYLEVMDEIGRVSGITKEMMGQPPHILLPKGIKIMEARLEVTTAKQGERYIINVG